MKTYVVELLKEDGNHEVLYYYDNLGGAKGYLESTGYDERVTVLMMQGNYFGEGFHKYRLVFWGMKKGKPIFKRMSNSDDIQRY